MYGASYNIGALLHQQLIKLFNEIHYFCELLDNNYNVYNARLFGRVFTCTWHAFTFYKRTSMANITNPCTRCLYFRKWMFSRVKPEIGKDPPLPYAIQETYDYTRHNLFTNIYEYM